MPNRNENNAPTRGELAAVSATFKALANEHRLLALLALARRPLAVNELNRQLPLAQSALSQHLARLRDAGLVVCRRDGSRSRYALADARVRRLVETICAEYRLPPPADGPQRGIAETDHAEPAGVGAEAALRL